MTVTRSLSLVLAAVTSVWLAGCSDRPIGTESWTNSGTDSGTDPTGASTGLTGSTGAAGTIGTAGTAGTTGTTGTTGTLTTMATSPVTDTGVSTGSATAGACEGEDPTDDPYDPNDPDDPCGLDAVYFEAGLSTLSALPECQLTNFAECIQALPYVNLIILESHASDGEVENEEQSIALTDPRGTAVRNFLVDQGFPLSKLQVISKGFLEASIPSDPADQRVRFIQQ